MTAPDTTPRLVTCAGPDCDKKVNPDEDGFHCSTSCLLAELRANGDVA